jgi:GH35 family endo-1,4-beta-xylanase
MWGLDDGTHWRTLDGSGGYGTLLDKDYNLKPAFYAVSNPNMY